MARPADRSERDALLNYFAPIERERLSGAHSEVFIVEQVGDPRGPSFLIDSHKPEELMYRGGTGSSVSGQPSKMFALKRQLIQQPDDEGERTYRELKIFMELRRLLMQGMSPNFVTIQGWIKCTPPLLFPSKYYHGSEDQFGLYVLEYAHHDLSHHKRLSLPRYRSMLFQVLWGLYLAQRELQFVHHDIHVRNILLQPLAEEVPGTAYRLAARDVPTAPWGERASAVGGDVPAAGESQARGSMVWFSPFFVVKITDFGLSSTRSETSTCDIEKAILELKKVVIDWNEEADLDTEAAATAKACPCTCGKGAPTTVLRRENQISEARKQLTNLRRESSRPGCSALRLLCHPFFDALRISAMPCACAGAWRFASDGFQPIAQSPAARVLASTLPAMESLNVANGNGVTTPAAKGADVVMVEAAASSAQVEATMDVDVVDITGLDEDDEDVMPVMDALAAVGLEKGSPVPIVANGSKVIATERPEKGKPDKPANGMTGKRPAPSAVIEVHTEEQAHTTRSMTRSRRGFNELELLLGVNPRWIADGTRSRQRSRTERLVEEITWSRTPSPARTPEPAKIRGEKKRRTTKRQSPVSSPVHEGSTARRRSRRLSGQPALWAQIKF